MAYIYYKENIAGARRGNDISGRGTDVAQGN
jgi:hypothetical protein